MQYLGHLSLKVIAVSCLVALVSCGDKVSSRYTEIAEGDFGIGVHLGDSTDAVHGVLGQPNSNKEVQGESNIEEYYFSLSNTIQSPTTPQLSLNYHDGRLVRLHNYYNPRDEETSAPPFLIEPVPGVKIGALRSKIIEALGAPHDSTILDTWTYAGPGGRQIILKANFTVAEEGVTQEPMCIRLQVVMVDPMPEQRGEEFDGKTELPVLEPDTDDE